MSLEVLLLSRYGRLGASSRLRQFQYLPYLKSRGVHVKTAPFFTDNYVQALGVGDRDWPDVIGSYFRRIKLLLARDRYDLLWVEKELFPWLPAGFDQMLLPRRIPYVVDYDDALFHRYDMHGSPFVRWLLGQKLDRVMSRAATVVVGNDYLAARARLAGASQVAYLPTVIDLDRYALNGTKEKGGFTVGWIGSPSTSRHLLEVTGALRRLRESSNVRLIMVGALPGELPEIGAEYRTWSEATEVAQIAEFDVGIMPLPDQPWERGKCGYKLIQYMACGKPVVASPVGVNAKIVKHGENGFLAKTESEWIQYLSVLSADRASRDRMGAAGRELVEREYCLQVTAPRLEVILRNAAQRGSVN